MYIKPQNSNFNLAYLGARCSTHNYSFCLNRMLAVLRCYDIADPMTQKLGETTNVFAQCIRPFRHADGSCEERTKVSG